MKGLGFASRLCRAEASRSSVSELMQPDLCSLCGCGEGNASRPPPLDDGDDKLMNVLQLYSIFTSCSKLEVKIGSKPPSCYLSSTWRHLEWFLSKRAVCANTATIIYGKWGN